MASDPHGKPVANALTPTLLNDFHAQRRVGGAVVVVDQEDIEGPA